MIWCSWTTRLAASPTKKKSVDTELVYRCANQPSTHAFVIGGVVLNYPKDDGVLLFEYPHRLCAAVCEDIRTTVPHRLLGNSEQPRQLQRLAFIQNYFLVAVVVDNNNTPGSFLSPSKISRLLGCMLTLSALITRANITRAKY